MKTECRDDVYVQAYRSIRCARCNLQNVTISSLQKFPPVKVILTEQWGITMRSVGMHVQRQRRNLMMESSRMQSESKTVSKSSAVVYGMTGRDSTRDDTPT